MKKVEGKIDEDSVESPSKEKAGKRPQEDEKETSDREDGNNDDQEDDAPRQAEEQESQVSEVNEVTGRCKKEVTTTHNVFSALPSTQMKYIRSCKVNITGQRFTA